MTERNKNSEMQGGDAGPSPGKAQFAEQWPASKRNKNEGPQGKGTDAAQEPTTKPVLDAEAEATLAERLRALGYID